MHIVDLDGAASGEPGNMDLIRELGASVLIPTQIGGGIRRIETIEELLKVGFERIILGTAAVEDPELVREACRRFSDSIIGGIDTREGRVATHGWQQETERGGIEFAQYLSKLGVKRFIYTDISRDGTLTEPNFSAITELIDAIQLPVIAAGGISSITHLKILKQIGAEGAIIGRALYTGDINLKQALAAVN